MLSGSVRLFALLLRSDRHRFAAAFLASLLLAVSFGSGYVAALSVGVFDAIDPVDQPLVATIETGPATLSTPHAIGLRVVAARTYHPELRPLYPTQDRAPPVLAA